MLNIGVNQVNLRWVVAGSYVEISLDPFDIGNMYKSRLVSMEILKDIISKCLISVLNLVFISSSSLITKVSFKFFNDYFHRVCVIIHVT